MSNPAPHSIARRRFFSQASALTLSASAVSLLSGCATSARAKPEDPATTVQDARILNTALSAEWEAIAAYEVGATSGLLSSPVKALAVQFQGHHREHAEALAKAVSQLGGKAVEPMASYTFPVERLQTEADVLTFAAELERGAVSAYAGAIPVFGDRALTAAAASILADEAMHWAVLRQALGLDPVPGAFFS